MIEKVVLNGEEHKLSPEYKDVRNKPSINGVELKEGDNKIEIIDINIDPDVDIVGEGETPSVINTGTSKSPTLKFSLPKGNKGDTGKVYVPNVDEESGDLNWSLEDNPQSIDSTNIKGPQGERGVGLDVNFTKLDKVTTVNITTDETTPRTLKTFQINDGNDGHNPCLGRLTVVPASFSAAFPDAIEGDYVYVDLYDDTTQTTTTTIYHYVLNGDTLEWDDGTTIDTEHPTFASTQTVESVAIKDLNGNNSTAATGVLSAEAGKELNEKLYGYIDMTSESAALSLPTAKSGAYKNTDDGTDAWYPSGILRSSGVINLNPYIATGYKYLKVTMYQNETNVHGGGFLTFVKRLDTPQTATSFNDLVSGGYLSSVHDAPNKVCINTPSNNNDDNTTFVEIPDDAVGILFQYRISSNSQSETFRKPKEVKCVGNHVNGDVDNMKEIVVDNLLSDNGAKALSAKQGMELGQKLKDVSFSETKVAVVESGNGQNVFSGYIPVISYGTTAQYTYSANSNSRSVVVPVDKTIKAVRFLSRVATSEKITAGYLFLNLGNISPSTIMQSGVDCTKYIVQSWQFDVGATGGVVDKTLNVPIGATHFVAMYYIQAAAPLKSDFYCYKQTGESVVEDIVAKEVALNYGTLTGNKTSQGEIFDVNGRIGMKNEAYSFHKYLCTPFIEASGFFNISNNLTLHGVLLCYDKDVSYIGQMTFQQYNELPNTTEYVKLCGTTANVHSGVTWEVGQITVSGNETESTIRLRSSNIPIENFGTVLSEVPIRFFLRYFNNEDVCLGYNSYAINGNMLTRGYCLNENNITFRDVEGATIDNVSYIRLICAYPKDIDITTSAAPVLYAPNDVVEQILRYETIGGRLIKDRNDYGKTFKMVYNAQVHKHQLDNDNPSPDTDKYYSTMILALPKNYSQEGTPTKLILFKNGATGFDDIFENDEKTGREFPYYEQLSYWVDQGYAVMDFHAGTSKYPKADCFGFATGLASAVSAYNFVINTFNIDTKIYLSCKSLGGYLAHIIIDTGVIPVRAAALLAPAIDNKRYCFGYDTTNGSNNAELYTRDIFIEDMGLEGDSTVIKRASGVPVAQRAYTEAAKTYIKNNIQKLNGFMPMLTGVINKTLDELLVLDCTTAGAFDDVKRLHKIPTKYWVATDDTNTPYNIAANYVKTCQNTFSPVYLRTMPSGRGAHNSVDSHANAPKVASITTRLGIVRTNVPVAYVEALDFLEGF